MWKDAVEMLRDAGMAGKRVQGLSVDDIDFGGNGRGRWPLAWGL